MDVRARKLNKASFSGGKIMYWMSRDMRVAENWALLNALEMARKNDTRVEVVFCLRSEFEHATTRLVDFMLSGLEEVEKTLRDYSIPFFFHLGDPVDRIERHVKENQIGAVVTDFNPLGWSKSWKVALGKSLTIPFFEVDAHNIVPCWIASPKQEYGAYTFRPKITRLLPEYLGEFPAIIAQKNDISEYPHTNWAAIRSAIHVDRSVSSVDWIVPGEKAAQEALRDFCEDGLSHYSSDRNDPTCDAQSDLSPYLHFGHLAPARVAFEVKKIYGHSDSKEAFLEELIVRRELSDNYCFNNPHYTDSQGFPDWAQKTIEKHKNDTREYIYDRDAFEKGETHDPLWNAAQMEMVKRGKMHGYMRMYWAKKIFEWTPDIATAQKYAIYLNDKYSLDGRDPNGYTGIAWSIGGVHDRAWFERPIFGMIRYMNENGARKKFDVDTYIKRWTK